MDKEILKFKEADIKTIKQEIDKLNKDIGICKSYLPTVIFQMKAFDKATDLMFEHVGDILPEPPDMEELEMLVEDQQEYVADSLKELFERYDNDLKKVGYLEGLLLCKGEKKMKLPYYLLQFTNSENYTIELKKEKVTDIYFEWDKCINLIDETNGNYRLELYKVYNEDLGNEGRELIGFKIKQEKTEKGERNE